MKKEHFEYLRQPQKPQQWPDPAPHKTKLCHADMITAILVLLPEDHENLRRNSPELLKRRIRYATSSRDGTVKIWNAHTLNLDITIKVTSGAWVTCMTYMTGSKRLVAGSANRMISFYSLESTNHSVVVSRIEDLVAIPMCLDYYKWGDDSNDGKYETLLCGDGLGICHMWNFSTPEWHYCQYKEGSVEKNGCPIHKQEIINTFNDKLDK